METLRYFDCNCRIGRRNIPHPLEFHSPERLVEEMKYFNIIEALVYHSLAREYSARTGNEKLLEEIKPYTQLHPCWVVVPHYTGEMLPPKEIIKEMINKGVKVVRLFPAESDNRFSLADWCSGEFLSLLETYRIPVLIELPGFLDIKGTNWEEVRSVCDNYPELPIILCGTNYYRFNRFLYPLLEKFSNLYCETSGYQAHRGLEEIANKYGANRLIFGSNMPVYTPGPAVMMLTYANLSFKEKELIAGKNLRRLLEEVKINDL